MASRRCLNAACGEAEPGGEWKKGWRLRSGGFAELCHKCGLAYEKLMFCDVFHLNESGWRECNYCGKRLHCGCIASKFLIDLLDGGGIQCIRCMKHSTPNEVVREFSKQNEHKVLSVRGVKDQIANDFCTTHCASELRLASSDGMMEGGTGDMCQAKAIQLGKQMEGNGQGSVLLSQSDSIDGSFEQITREQVSSLIEETGTEARSIKLLNRNPGPVSSSCIYRRDERKTSLTENMICKSPDQTCVGPAGISLEMSKPGNLGIPQKIPPTIGADVEGKDKNQQVQRACSFIPMPPMAGDVSALEASKNVLPHMRSARPPGEGRGRHQLLPRYWPRITEQELQQISGDSNSTIVPLFEKVLTASDTGRIGRLVLPKACAEAYFPPISQPEGLPLTIQDAKGKDWQFQFRYWPNNNSRMYVLEGVTPCIQSLQLQAGDTVTFSRIDPEGRLVMGYRKANNSETLQDSQILAIPNAGLGNEASLLAANKDLPIISGYSICQSSKDNADPQSSCSLSEYLNSVHSFTGWHKTDVTGGMVNGGSPLPLLVPERRTSHNIGFKSKRLHMDNDDALELKLTWEEAQDLLCPPPSAKPNIFMVENEEVEEYEEPPVFGKRVIFTARTSGGHDQWVQCDNCFKWRRLPLNVTILSNWTCADNTWDPKRSSCSIPCELSSTELQDLLGQSADMKRQKIVTSLEQNSSKPKASGLDTLAAVAAHKEVGSPPTPSPEITTRHPRHRPGCTCIVCTQPPSGKGPKHSPACTCNVCMSVKRRFRTLRMRKQQRQSKLEEAEAQKKLSRSSKEQAEACSSLKSFRSLDSLRESDPGHPEMKKGQIDLNFFPESDESDQNQPSVASHPLEAYLQQHGFKSLNTGTASELEIRHDDSTRHN